MSVMSEVEKMLEANEISFSYRDGEIVVDSGSDAPGYVVNSVSLFVWGGTLYGHVLPEDGQYEYEDKLSGAVEAVEWVEGFIP